jgi:signal peptidase I
LKQNKISFSNTSLIELIKATLAKNFSFRFKVNGSSMSPFIQDGDIVSLSSYRKGDVALGDVIAFINPSTGKLALHRVVGRYNGGCLIKGDNIPCPDGLIPKENILGYVSKIERNGWIVHMGLGPERWIIAFLSKNGLLCFAYRLWRIIPFSLRQYLKERIL